MGQPIQRYLPVVFVPSQREARGVLRRDAARIVIIKRRHLRSAVFHCPCGCGDVLTINLDKGSGAAWRARFDAAGLTLLPSVSRPDACRSHFIMWRGETWWRRFDGDDADWPIDLDEELREEWRQLRSRDRRNPLP